MVRLNKIRMHVKEFFGFDLMFPLSPSLARSPWNEVLFGFLLKLKFNRIEKNKKEIERFFIHLIKPFEYIHLSGLFDEDVVTQKLNVSETPFTCQHRISIDVIQIRIL